MKSANAVVQQHIRKLLKMGILMPETCRVSKNKNKNSKWHLVGLLFFSYHKMHGPINIVYDKIWIHDTMNTIISVSSPFTVSTWRLLYQQGYMHAVRSFQLSCKWVTWCSVVSASYYLFTCLILVVFNCENCAERIFASSLDSKIHSENHKGVFRQPAKETTN